MKIQTALKTKEYNFLYIIGINLNEENIQEVKINNIIFKVKGGTHYNSIGDVPVTVLDIDTQEDLKKYKNFEIELIYK